MSDEIWLNGIECKVRIGVPDAERRKPQKLLLDVGLRLDVSAAAASDDFRRTVDYWAVEKYVREEAETGERRLVETLAEKIARLVLAREKMVESATVRVHKKPAAMPKTDEVVVSLTRRR